METLKYKDLPELPTVVDIMTAARALGLSRTYAYDLARRDQFPCRVLRIGTCYRVPTADLLKLLGATREASRAADPPG
ncbi:helix-turn-helix domain-containing protein [Spirillospora sp. NPDC048911]|uniref:helix-turn-helix domain-containing protein n=1 Tax=Spirillospora sp. NPDC048911 TaxID=3364527 RepID=UPI00371BC1D2